MLQLHGEWPEALEAAQQGQAESARAAIQLAMDEARGPEARSRLLPASVEILLVSGDTQQARTAAEELTTRAGEQETPALKAMAAQAQGAVLLAEGDARAALSALREAWSAWQDVDAVYEAARVRVLIGHACPDLGDVEAAEMEFDAARWIFQRLGSSPDLQRLESSSRALRPAAAGGLCERVIQVLRLVAVGKTNRQIARELFISERTVERHVSNIFDKLDVPSRAAATAYAYQHQLL
jgi:DNA-binding NarL/FixJ family response regulator